MDGIWIIQSHQGNIIGCFQNHVDAQAYIQAHALDCILTDYPVNQTVYDWVVENNFWQPQNDLQKTKPFRTNFSSAYLEHEHYVAGVLQTF